ncbi:sensor histidine kinase [Paenibacillus sp. J2TS4]|uniref:sensor histidine kinase n=1 Tax=Paenibacillus sp. J2TS4 TaxID=2807194 RepID=UPI001B0913DC|nr:sensor histidine kinase [Paenibacillus sp. J2TS4]GIP35419.1 histidine kinase [Paenibacillus sp. J2TS4]
MSYPLTWLRYSFIATAALGTLFIGQIRPDTYAVFTFWALLLLWIAQLAGKWKQGFHLLLLLELAVSVWLNERYGGLYFLTFFATLILLVQAGRPSTWPRLLAVGLCWTALAISLEERSITLIAGTHILFGAFAILLHGLASTSGKKQEVEQLYDELRRKHYELEEARSRLVDYARKVQLFSQMEERNRISHDLHDDLGHSITRLKMMMEAAIRLSGPQPDKSAELMNQVRDQLGESMEALRRTVRKLQPNEQIRSQYSLHKFLDEASAYFGLPVRLETSGIPYSLYPSVEFALYRNTQEAITNAIRHGDARSIDIRMHYEPQQIMLSVSNDGKLPEENPQKQRGLGISGMEERVKLLGGELLVESGPPFTVTTILPHPIANS